MNDREDDELLAGQPIAALRRHFRGTSSARRQSPDCAQLFTSFCREWRSGQRPSRAAHFLRLVAACELHDLLLIYLLQLHVDDATCSLLEFAEDACFPGHCCTNEEDASAMQPVGESLLVAAGLLAFNSDKNQESRVAQCQSLMDGISSTISRVDIERSVFASFARLLERSRGNKSETAWKQFEDLSHELDAKLSTSRSGRALMHATDLISRQQQTNLVGVRSTLGDGDDSAGENMSVMIKNGSLWDIAHKLLSWINKMNRTMADTAISKDSSSVEDPNGRDARELRSDHGVELNTGVSLEDLDEYLLSGSQHENGHDSIAEDPYVSIERPSEQSPIELMISAVSSSRGGAENGIVNAVINHLSTTEDSKLMQAHVSFLLAYQIESDCRLVDRSSPEATDLERRVQRVANSLTAGADYDAYLRTFVVLSAFVPERLIATIVQEARKDTRHHSLFVNILRWSPLLISWSDSTTNRSAGSKLKKELHQMVVEVSSDPTLYQAQHHNVEAFLLLLFDTIGNEPSPVISFEDLLQHVVLSGMWEDESESLPPQPPSGVLLPASVCSSDASWICFHLTKTLVRKFVLKCQRPSDLGVWVTLFALTVKAYASMGEPTTKQGGQHREMLLLLLKDVLELFTSDGSILEITKVSLSVYDGFGTDAALLSLVAPIFAESAKFELLDSLFSGAEKVDRSTLTVDQVKQCVELAVWMLFWMSQVPDEFVSKMPYQRRQLWCLLDDLAGTDFWSGENKPDSRVNGAHLIQESVAAILLSSGDAFFRMYVGNVLPYLLTYEPVDLPMRGAVVVRLPKCLTRADEASEVSEVVSSLTSTHWIATYLVKCWSLVAISFHSDRDGQLMDLLRATLGACDRAVSASTSQRGELLYCLQLVCYLAYAADRFQLTKHIMWTNASAPLEVLVVRVLHELNQIGQFDEPEAKTTQHMVATWLALLPSSIFAPVSHYLAATHGHSAK